MNRQSLIRRLEDLHNELAHLRLFAYGYTYTERFARLISVAANIRSVLAELNGSRD